MIKVLAPALRHPTNRSLEDFHRYWGESHGPLFANTKMLRGYVQHLTLPEAYEGQPEPTFDGVSMFWYDDLETMGVATNDPDVLALMEGIYGVPGVPSDPPPADPDQREVTLLHQVLKDDAQLFDRSTTWPMHHKRAAVVAEEHVIVDGQKSPEMVKAIFMASKLPGLTLSEFLVRWEHVHGPLAANVPGLRHYDQYHAVLESYPMGTNTHDGWSELWFDDVSSLRAAVASPEWAALAEDGATLFAQPIGVGVARERDPEGRVVDVPGLGRRRHERGRRPRAAARARLRDAGRRPGRPGRDQAGGGRRGARGVDRRAPRDVRRVGDRRAAGAVGGQSLRL